MAKSSKKKQKEKAKKARLERRFEPRATANKWVVYACGVVGATAMGMGTWGQFGPALSGTDADPFKYAPWVLAGGAILVGIAIWFGTSGEPSLRVGDAGVGVEKGDVRRIAWYAVEKVELDGGSVKVTGKDELGRDLVIRARIVSHPQAAAWIVREARARIGKVVSIPEEASEVPAASEEAGEVLTVEPVQVVGKHCAESGKVIAYEPDARICARCDRVYHKEHVPVTCACGNSLAGFRGASGASGASGAKKSEEKEEAALAEAVAVADDAPKAPAPPAEPADKPQA
jgi:hypothetical protein